MNVEALKAILYGGSLNHKLVQVDSVFRNEASEFLSIPSLERPGREGLLLGNGEGKPFPKKSDLINETERGRLLHFFANHELLAIETMAYVLLRFPDADPAFRNGVLRTLQDEQKHLAKYVSRMNEFGVTLGDFSLNMYFWNTLKNMKSPLDYITQMSLTFEQANLDFALFYAELFEREVQDEKTARLLREVHDDEIKHVAHGAKWLSRLKVESDSDFESYTKNLPFPMTPRRARGTANFFASESRALAGLSPDFIENVRITGGSRGKVPDYYFFNPGCELEHSMPTLPERLIKKGQELAPLMLWMAGEEDAVQLSEKPELSFLSRAFQLRGDLPEIITPGLELDKRYAAFEEIHPWGWSPSAWKKLEEIKRCVKGGVRSAPTFLKTLHSEKLFSKSYWKKILLDQGVDFYHDQSSQQVLVKIDQSTSGRGHFVCERAELDSPLMQKRFERIATKGEGYVIEPFLKKVADFSVQYEISKQGKITRNDPRFFKVDHLFQYRGSYSGALTAHAEYQDAAELILRQRSEWEKVHEIILSHLQSQSYCGPVGIDCMVHLDKRNELQIMPVIEVNARLTMGRVALEIEKFYARQNRDGKGVGFFSLITDAELVSRNCRNFKELEEKLFEQHRSRFVAATPSSANSTWCYAIFQD